MTLCRQSGCDRLSISIRAGRPITIRSTSTGTRRLHGCTETEARDRSSAPQLPEFHWRSKSYLSIMPDRSMPYPHRSNNLMLDLDALIDNPLGDRLMPSSRTRHRHARLQAPARATSSCRTMGDAVEAFVDASAAFTRSSPTACRAVDGPTALDHLNPAFIRTGQPGHISRKPRKRVNASRRDGAGVTA